MARTYAFEVRALNRGGVGPAALIKAIPATMPGMPTGLTASIGNGEAKLTWQAPEDNGGMEITEYQYRYAREDSTLEDAAWNSVGLNLTVTVVGLVNGENYVFEVRALNQMGSGSAAPMSAVHWRPCRVRPWNWWLRRATRRWH